MSFNIDAFIGSPSEEQFNLARKTDLLDLAKHYNVSQVKSHMTKQEIKNVLVKYSVEEEIFEDKPLSLIVETQSEYRLRELELKMQFEEMSPRAISGAEDGLHTVRICCIVYLYSLIKTNCPMPPPFSCLLCV